MLKIIPTDQVIVSEGRRPVRNVEELAESIRQLGLLNPITVSESLRLIAGRNRLAACHLLGWDKIPANVLKLSDLDAELAEIDENLVRNELTVLERGEQLKRRKEIYEAIHPETKRGVPGGNARHGSANEIISFADDAAGKVGVTSRTVQQEVQIAESITEEVKESIRETPLADNKTDLTRLARVPEEQQSEVVAALTDGEAKTMAQACRLVERRHERPKAKDEPSTSAEPSWRIVHGDCVTSLPEVRAGSVRMAFADPPYNQGVNYGDGAKADRLSDEQYLSWCREWMAGVVRALAPDGSFWVLISDQYADHFGILLRDVGLHRRQWLIWYESFGVCDGDKRGFGRCSRHLLWCVKDAKQLVFNAEAVTRPSDRQEKYGDKRADPGGKTWDSVWGINPPIPRLTGTCKEREQEFPTQLPLALVRPIVLCASDPGDLVLDPFNGSGTTGVAAVKSGRRYIGIEKSKRFADLARHRLNSVVNGE